MFNAKGFSSIPTFKLVIVDDMSKCEPDTGLKLLYSFNFIYDNIRCNILIFLNLNQVIDIPPVRYFLQIINRFTRQTELWARNNIA